MENKTQNLVNKIVTYSIVFLGVLFTIWVMRDDNPAETSYEQQKQWANQKATDENTSELFSYIQIAQLNNDIYDLMSQKSSSNDQELESLEKSIDEKNELIDLVDDSDEYSLAYFEGTYPNSFALWKSSNGSKTGWEEESIANVLTGLELNAFLSELTKFIKQDKEKTLWSDVSSLINFSMFIIYLAAGLVIAAFGYLYYIDPKKAIKTLAGIGIFIVFMVLVYFLSAGESGSDMKLASTAINSTIILISIALLGWLGGSLVKYIK
jgi:heme/copper-type cytochrome/quinol oxidase subunit 4